VAQERTGTGESPEQRLARNVSELLQELRVAQTGTQFLLAFLLAVAFTDRYERESAFVHAVHLTDVVVTALASALLIAPAAWHRVLFRERRREAVLTVGTRCAVAGLVLLAVAIAGTVLLVADVVVGGVWAGVVGGAVGLVLAGLWFGVPRLLPPDDPAGER
jgi:O-antigen/teichoic acid export membrane protein